MWTNRGIRSEVYWALDPNYELTLESDEAYAKSSEDFYRSRAMSIAQRISSWFHLSGGLDSSSVTCVARKILNETTEKRFIHFRTYSTHNRL